MTISVKNSDQIVFSHNIPAKLFSIKTFGFRAIFVADYPGNIPVKFGLNWPSGIEASFTANW